MQLHQRVARSRAALIGSVSLALLAIACRESGNDASPSAPPVSPAQRAAIADTLRRAIASAYDFSRPGVVPRLMALYPDSGPVVSAAAGRVVTSRAALQGQIQHFWEAVGQNMREPRWVWGDTHVEVLSPSAAVLTATYTIPHRTPAGAPHVIGGAWTAVFERRGRKWVIVQEHLSDTPQQPAAAQSQ